VFSASFLGVVVVERGPITRSFILGHQRFPATAGRMLLPLLVGALYFGLTLALNNAFRAGLRGRRHRRAALSLIPLLAGHARGQRGSPTPSLRHHRTPKIGNRKLAAN